MSRRRRYVRCWVCGRVARRVAHGRMGVVGQRRTVDVYGPCDFRAARAHRQIVRALAEHRGREVGAAIWEAAEPACRGLMLRPGDCRRVVRAARRWERAGGNLRSEYDIG